jgi:hypothetical protein
MANAYVSGSVYRHERAILLVLHEEDGDWQFLDGGAFDANDAVAVHVDHVFAEHDDVRPLADLPAGWAAERTTTERPWERYVWPGEDGGSRAAFS